MGKQQEQNLMPYHPGTISGPVVGFNTHIQRSSDLVSR